MDRSDPPAMPAEDYVLDAQVGFLLRRATQRHLTIFSELIAEPTPTQFAALAKLCELGPTSQNALGRHTAMDAATIKGVVDRLRKRGLVSSAPDPNDQRRIVVRPTAGGRAAFEAARANAHEITRQTLAPLTPEERATFVTLLKKLI